MRRKFSFLLPIIIMVAVAASCICVYLLATDQLNVNNTANMVVDTTNETEITPTSVVLAKNELPKIDASVVTQDLVIGVARNFANDDDITASMFDFTDTDTALNRLVSGEIDAAITPYPSDDVITLAKAQGKELEMIPIAKDGFVFYTNKINPVNSLKVSEKQKIYIGEIKNWIEVGGDDNDIVAFQRPSNSTNQREMIRSVMKGLPIIEAPKDYFNDSYYGEITDIIADYDNSENGIAYSYYKEAKYLYDLDENIDNSVKILKVNDIEANYDTIKDGSYPIVINYYLVKVKDMESEHLDVFQGALLSERGKTAIKEAGYIDE